MHGLAQIVTRRREEGRFRSVRLLGDLPFPFGNVLLLLQVEGHGLCTNSQAHDLLERAVRRVPQGGERRDEDEHEQAGQALDGIRRDGAHQRIGKRRRKEQGVESRQIRAECDNRPLRDRSSHDDDDKLYLEAIACRQPYWGPTPGHSLGKADDGEPERPLAPLIAQRPRAPVGPPERDLTERADDDEDAPRRSDSRVYESKAVQDREENNRGDGGRADGQRGRPEQGVNLSRANGLASFAGFRQHRGRPLSGPDEPPLEKPPPHVESPPAAEPGNPRANTSAAGCILTGEAPSATTPRSSHRRAAPRPLALPPEEKLARG